MKIKYLPNAVSFCCDDRIDLIVAEIVMTLDRNITEWEKEQ